MSQSANLSTEKRVQEPKQPQTVQLQVVVPWFLVAILACLVLGVISGWFIHASAAHQVTVVETTSKQ